MGEVIVTIEPGSNQQSGGKDQPSSISPHLSALKAGRRVLAAPAVRKLAREMGIDLAQVPGSGPAGRVLPGDVRSFAEQPKTETVIAKPQAKASPVATESVERTPAPPTPGGPQRLPPGDIEPEVEPLRGLRRRMATRMELAWRTIPHATIFEEIDATQLVALRRHLQPEAKQHGVRLTALPFIIKAVVQALRAHPYVNASIEMEQQKIIKHRVYHIGVATDTPAGLLVPVVHHADRLTLNQLAGEISRLAQLAGQGKLSHDDMSGGTFTITNFGSLGSQQAAPIINPPEAAILGCGVIADKPVAVQGQVEVRPVLPLALSFDHRLLDGAAAAKFMAHLKRLLADPRLLLLELV